MAAASPNGEILVITGINGYLASVLGHTLLTKGYSIRGTVRSLRSANALLEGAYAPFKDRVQIYEVPDITVDGAFDNVVQGAHGIFHMASPVSLSLQSYDEAITPAVNGTTSLLSSALLHAGPQLKSIVITSSISALYSGRPAPGSTITESGKSAINLSTLRDDIATNRIPKVALYSISKIAADAAVWDWRDAHKPHFAVSSIYPSLVIGPPVQLPSSADALCMTLKPLWDIFSGASTTLTPGMGGGLYVDVRDVAQMHYWAYAHPEAVDGEKFIASGGYGPAQAMADILHEAYPEREGVMPKGNPGEGYTGYADGKVGRIGAPETAVTVSGKKAERIMGIEWVDFRDSVKDTAKTLEPLLEG